MMRLPLLPLALVVVTLSSLAHAQAERSEPKSEPMEVPEVGDAFRFETDDGRFGLKPLAHIQTLLFIQQELAEGREASAGFLVRRARLGLDGHLFTKDLRFQLEAKLDRGQPGLQDAIIEYELTPLVVLQAGQYKRPFSREFLTSSSESLTFERSLSTRSAFTGRDIGVMLHNNFEKSPGIEYAVGVFNGTGDALSFNRPPPAFDLDHAPRLFHPAFVARAGVNVGGIDGYREGDLEGGPLRLAVATSLALDAPTAFHPGLASAALDFSLKAHGAWASGEVIVESGPLDGSAGDSHLGLHLEGSYTLAGSLLPLLGYSLWAPLGGNTARHELTAGAAVLVFGHHFRLMTDAVLGFDQAPGALTTDVGVRVGLGLTL